MRKHFLFGGLFITMFLPAMASLSSNFNERETATRIGIAPCHKDWEGIVVFCKLAQDTEDPFHQVHLQDCKNFLSKNL